MHNKFDIASEVLGTSTTTFDNPSYIEIYIILRLTMLAPQL
jgi:hypothetical protein